MSHNSIELEEQRLKDFEKLSDYGQVHERHRIFPALFENRNHKKIIDLASGVGVVGRNISENCDAELICNDISPTCLKSLSELGLKTSSFDLDDPDTPFPFPDETFDAVIALATIEHLIHIDHFVAELRRILVPGGYLYISAPNYAGLTYLLPFLVTGRTFHDPSKEEEKYEFYAHLRYFTFRTLLEYIQSFGFQSEAVYIPLPEGSTRYRLIKKRSRLMASVIRLAMRSIYTISPRWAAEPVLCMRKENEDITKTYRKVLL